MNLTNDAFGYMLTFLDIDSIVKLAQTCKTYNILCKKHTLYSKLLVMNMNKIPINIEIKHLTFTHSDKYAIIYRAMKLGDGDVLKYYQTKVLDKNFVNGCFYSIYTTLSPLQRHTILSVFPYEYFKYNRLVEVIEYNNTKKIDL